MTDDRKYRVLDLFCGQGGASKGYQRAGMEIAAGVDLCVKENSQALRYYEQGLPGVVTVNGDWRTALDRAMNGAYGRVDFIHASPPCQRYTAGLTADARAKHPDLVGPVRDALRNTGMPFVIENVPGAPWRGQPAFLYGDMFGLTVKFVPSDFSKTQRGENKLFVQTERRADGKLQWNEESTRRGYSRDIPHQDLWGSQVEFRLERRRGFEAHKFFLPSPDRDPSLRKVPVMTIIKGTPTPFWNAWFRCTIPTETKNELMGTPWMNGDGVAESIPPAYTKYVGEKFLLEAVDSQP